MAFSKTYVIGFATAVCVVASLGVSGASMGLKPYQDANRLRAQQAKVLTALGLPEQGEMPYGEAVTQLYDDRIEVLVIGRDGKQVDGKTLDDAKAEAKLAKNERRDSELLVVYLRKSGDTAEGYAIEMNGNGLWGPLSGYLAIKPDGATVQGATFDAPKETPGLGAEIMKPAWQDQWAGKTIKNGAEFASIQVMKGSASLLCAGRVEHCVDGVSGATITSRGVDVMVANAITAYGPYLQTIK